MASEMIVDIRKSFSGRFALDMTFKLVVYPAAVLIVFGPSGSGKTTLLRCLAGLEWPDEGIIRFGDHLWFDARSRTHVRPQDRKLGVMFQEYALFPHESVRGNIAYGLGSLHASEREGRISEAISLLQLDGLEKTAITALSGGQRQRVALARAIARKPTLLLLDEPLSALDVPTRLALGGELRRLLRSLGIPSVVVTHDWEEALTLGDRMVVLKEGTVLQVGTPQSIFNAPTNVDVAKIVGIETVIPGTVRESANGLLLVEAAGITLCAVGEDLPGTDVFVCIRAEDIVLEPIGTGTTSARNHVPASVRDIISMGALVRVDLESAFPFSAIVTRSALEDLHLTHGAKVVAAIKAGSVHLIPRPSTASF